MNYINQAFKGKNNLWMFLLTTSLVSGMFILNFITYLFTSKEDMDEVYDLMKSIPANISLIVNLLPFVFLLGLLFLLVKQLHERSILSLSTSRVKIDWSRSFFSFSLIIITSLLIFAVSAYFDPSAIEMQFDLKKFSILFAISVLLFPFQIGLEEYLFRGYLMQQIGVIARNRWFPLMITSLFFGLFHSANPEVAEIGFITMVFYIGTGLFLGIITLMDDGLELALGFHLGNNLLAALLITSDWSALQTDAIFRYTASEANITALEIILPVFLFYPILIYIFAKVYKWTNWKDKLTGPVTKDPLPTPSISE